MIVDRYPTSHPFEETELVRISRAIGHTLAADLVLGMNPTVKAGISATQTSVVVGALRDVSAVWKYAHNDAVSDPVKNCALNPKFHPPAMFGFQKIKTEVGFEVTLLWSLSRNSWESRGQRKYFYPIQWPLAKGTNPMFFNFLYQIAVVVDLEKIPDGKSWIMPDMKIDNVKREDLNPSKDPVALERTTETALHDDSESGRLNDVVSTDCEVIIKTAVEGKVVLTPVERKGLNISHLSRRQKALKSFASRLPAVTIEGTSDGFAAIKYIILRLCRAFYTSDPFTISGPTAWSTT